MMFAASALLAALIQDPERPLASVAVLAIRDGKVVYQGHAGCKRFDAQGCVPTAEGDLYRVASVSKMVTALGVLRLVEAGILDLDRDIGSYLGYTVRHPAFPGAPLTLRRLLSHTASLTDEAGYRLAPDGDLRSLLSAGGSQWDSRHAPGTWFRYANLNYGVIGSVMESATGERFDRLMKKLVLDPLGIEGGFNPAGLTPAAQAKLATLYRRKLPGGPWLAQIDAPGSASEVAPADYRPGTNGTLYSPQGGLRISAQGLGVIVATLLDGGRHQGRQFLSTESIQALTSVHWRKDGPNGDDAGGLFKAWGLGIQLYEGSAVLRGAGHLGDAWGLLSGVAYEPATRSGVVYIIGGMGFDPSSWPGHSSPLSRIEEKLLAHAYSFVRP